MIDLLKKSVAYAFALISAIFTFVPEAIFGKVVLIPEAVINQFKWLEGNALEINIVVNRILLFGIIWIVAAIIYKLYLRWRNEVSIKGNNYKITVEYGDVLKAKKCKRVINLSLIHI